MQSWISFGFQVILAICTSGISFAQGAPTFPQPPTKEACAAFRTQTIEYWNRLSMATKACTDRPGRRYGSSNPEVAIRCSNIRWPTDCAAHYEARDCAAQDGYRLMAQCDAAARALDDAKKPAKNAITNNEFTKLPAKLTELKEVGKLLKRASEYSKLSDDEKLKFHGDLASHMNKYGNAHELSKVLTKDALGRVTTINKDALSSLNRALTSDTKNDLDKKAQGSAAKIANEKNLGRQAISAVASAQQQEAVKQANSLSAESEAQRASIREIEARPRWAAAAMSGDGGWSTSYNHTSQGNAEADALRRCSGSCTIVRSFSSGCTAVAWCANSDHGWWWGSGGTRNEAERNALRACQNHSSPDCYIKTWVCQ